MDFVVPLLGLILIPIVVMVVRRSLIWINAKLHYLNVVNQLPGPKRLPILGNALQFIFVGRDKYINVFTEICKQFSDQPLIRIQLAHKDFVFILKTSAAEEFLNSTKDMPKAEIYDMVKPWLGTGLLTSSGEKWQKQRKLLTPSFHFQILTDFMPSFNEQSQILVSRLKSKAGGSVFDMHPYITLCTLDIICVTAMGKHIHAQINGDSEYVTAIRNMGEIFSLRSARPWLHNDWIFSWTALGKRQKQCLQILHSFSRQVIQDRKLMLLNGNYKTRVEDQDDDVIGKKRRLAFLDTLLELPRNSGCLSDEEIRLEVDTFMFAGHDTTSSCVNWTLFLLGGHSDVQEKLAEELQMVFGNEERSVTTGDLIKLRYLEAVIKESLRICPPIPLYGRRLTKETVIAGYRIPANTDVLVPLKWLHNSEDNFTNSSQFCPSRFLSTDSTDQTRTSLGHCGYQPFSCGPRNCIGQKFALMEIKVILTHLLRRYRVVTHDKYEDMKIVADPVLRSLKGFNMSLHFRN